MIPTSPLDAAVEHALRAPSVHDTSPGGGASTARQARSSSSRTGGATCPPPIPTAATC